MDTTIERRGTINLRLKAYLLSLSLPLSLSTAGQLQAQSILPPRPDAIGGGNPFEGLGRTDDPNPSRVGDFPDLNLADTPASQGDGAPIDPNLNPTQANQTADAAAPSTPDNPSPGADSLGATPGAADALLKAQQLAKEEGVIDPSQQKPGLLSPETGADRPANNQNEASFFKVVPDSPIRTTLVDIREGRYEAALNQLKTMYQRKPSAIELQYLMGVSAVMLRRNPEAIEHYQRVLDDKTAPLRLKQMAQRGLVKIQPK